MDFIEGLPLSLDFSMIFVVIGRFTKYAHFFPLSHPYTVDMVVKLFISQIFKLHGHGMPFLILTNRDVVH